MTTAGRDSADGLDVAIIGMAGRFPGARNVAEFWRNLKDGVESVTFFTDDELAAAGVAADALENPAYVKAAPVLEGIELFDAGFFGFSPREAAILDPQHRIFLECAWEALEASGHDPERFEGPIGVYAGAGLGGYLLFNLLAGRRFPATADAFQILLGNDKDYLTTRVSYKLNLKGPSVAVQTACSTSLVAVHLACQSLLTCQCDMALAGGISLRVPQKAGHFYQPELIFSPDGHCRAFDAGAQGTIFGSGAGIVVLRRLADALADGDRIAAVIKGSAINNDGAVKIGFTAPGVESQANVVAAAQAMAGIDPATITAIEAHGTGTPLGDPIEIAALTRVFRARTQKKGFCAIGSAKSNVGHLDTAAGVTGLIKMILALQHRWLPPTLHFEQPNPQIDFANSPFYVNAASTPWPANGLPCRAGVSSFGIGGTNAHVVLEEAPLRQASGPSRPSQLLVLSAKTAGALDAATANLADHLRQHPDATLADVAYTLHVGRQPLKHRRIVVSPDIETAVRALDPLDPERVLTAVQESKDRPVAFMCSGQGAQYPNMGRELYDVEPVFREQVDLCATHLTPHLGFDLREILYQDDSDSEAPEKLARTAITQPALFVTEYALARLLLAWGLRPSALIGHSIGEYVAACLAGVFSLEDALRLVAARGRLMQALPGGAMLSVSLAPDELQPLIGGRLSIAAINAPSLCVVSGPGAPIAELERQLTERSIGSRRLHVSHAFHSAMVEPIVEPFVDLVKRVRLHPPSIPFVSNVSGTWITSSEATDPRYWAAHLREPVRFGDGIAALMADERLALLEVGPGQTLATFAKQQPGQTGRTVLTSLRHPQEPQSDVAFLLTAVGRLWLAGVTPDWRVFYERERRHRVALPTYPFERRRYWIEPQQSSESLSAFDTLGAADGVAASEPADLYPRPALDTAYVGPRNDVEQTIAGIWQTLLGVERLGVYDNFFELGGHSLLATQVLARVSDAFRVNIPLRRLFEKPTVAALASVIEACRANQAPDAEAAPVLPSVVPAPADRHDPFPLTDMQQAQWIGRIGAFSMGNVAAHVYFEPESAELDLERLGRAWQRVVDRHEMLRAIVLPDGRQRILPHVPPYAIDVEDLRGLDPDAKSARLEALRHRMSHQIRPTDQWPLFEVRASRLDDRTVRLHLSFDLLIADIASLRILMRDWYQLYENPDAGLPELELSFRDYVLAEATLKESDAYRRSLLYWQTRLANLPPAPELPLARNPATVTQPRFERQSTWLDPDRWRRLKSRGAQAGLSPSAVVITAFAEVLSAWSRTPRFCINTTIINRLPLHPQVRDIVGEFASFAPLEVDNSADRTFEALARQLQEQSWEDLEHRTVSGVRILRELARVQGGTSGAVMPVVFTSTLVHATEGQEYFPTSWLGDMKHAISQTPQVWLDHSVFEDERGLMLNWHAAADLFPAGVIEEMFAAYVGLLERLAADETTWSTRPVLTPAAQLAARAAVNATAAPVPAGLLQTRIAAHVEQRPDQEAVVAPGRTLTYAALWEEATALGSTLRARGAAPNQLIAVVMEKGWEQVVAVLGVLEAGAAYVPIDPALPRERLIAVLAHAEVRLAVTQPGWAARVDWPAGVEVIVVEAPASGVAALAPGGQTPVHGGQTSGVGPPSVVVPGVGPHPVGCAPPAGASDRGQTPALDRGQPAALELYTGALEWVQTPADLAYVIYTSGSTGVPKGVMIAHQAAVNTVEDITARFGVGPGDRVLGLSSLSFDLSVYDIFGTLGAGATLVLPAAGSERDPAEWLTRVVGAGVTVWNSVPALMEMFLEYAGSRPEPLPLRVVLLSGDWIPVGLPGRIQARVPGVRVVSLGGATEAAIWSILYPIETMESATTPTGTPEWDSIPYGWPMVNQQFHVLDDRLAPRPVWVPGALYIGGVGLAEGYWRDAEQTAARFVRHPSSGERLYRTGDLGRYRPDGTIEFLGREDFQVKVHGHRIELGEIEAALAEHPAVKAAVVTAIGERTHKRLAGYVVVSPDAGVLDLAELKTFLRQKLPDYMVPADVIVLDALPLSANGKVDRKALPSPDRAVDALQEAAADPHAPVDRLARIFAGVLGVDQVGVHENFFQMGGDSIMGIQIITRANEEGLAITPQQLFEHQTIAELASVARTVAAGAEQGLVTGDIPLTPLQHWFFERDVPAVERVTQVVALEATRPIDASVLERTLGHVLAHHDGLRIRFERSDSGWRQVAAGADEPVPLTIVETDASADAIAALRSELQGPALRLVLVRESENGTSRLLWVVHRLLLDRFSWPILLADLQTAYEQVSRGENVQLPAKTTSFKHWAERLQEYARSPERAEDLPLWSQQHDSKREAGVTGDQSGAAFSTSLDANRTRELLEDVPRAYGTRTSEVLLAALGQAFHRCTDGRSMLVEVESHTRDNLFDDVDLTRTVGCFTTIWPLLLKLDRIGQPGEALKLVKEQVRRVPHAGASYGALRYLGSDEAVRARLRSDPAADAGFTFLGAIDDMVPETGLFKAPEAREGPAVASLDPGRYPLQLVGYIDRGRLRVDWTYRVQSWNVAAVGRLTHDFVEALDGLIGHCLSGEAGGYTPSDFPQADLSQADLDKFLSAFGQPGT